MENWEKEIIQDYMSFYFKCTNIYSLNSFLMNNNNNNININITIINKYKFHTNTLATIQKIKVNTKYNNST